MRPREREKDDGGGDWETRAMEMEEWELLLEGRSRRGGVASSSFVEAAQLMLPTW